MSKIPRIIHFRFFVYCTGLFFLLFVVVACWFIRKYFGLLLPDQILYHLQQGGMEYSDPKLLWRALRYLFGTVLIAAILIWLHVQISILWRRLLFAVLLAVSTWSVAITLDLKCSGQSEDYLAENYVSPRLFSLIPPAERPDILIVFFESLELAHTDAESFGRNLVPNMTSWRSDHRQYGQMYNLSGASWTMGGMFTTLCGIPLQSVGLLAQNTYEFGNRFFSGGTCITDILAADGYDISFYGGASLKFAGKGKFLAAHSVARRFGAEEWAARGVEVPNGAWGIYDAELIQQISADFKRPRNDMPRMDIILTVNSHPPHGGDDPGCSEDASRIPHDNAPGLKLRRAYQCTDRLVAKLIQEYGARADGRNKIILVQGDHLTMRGEIDSQLSAYAKKMPRMLFHAVGYYDGMGRNATPKTSDSPSRQFTQVDLMPTLLAEAGFQWAHPEGRMGMGTALSRRHGENIVTTNRIENNETLAERDGFTRMNSRSVCQSALFKSLW